MRKRPESARAGVDVASSMVAEGLISGLVTASHGRHYTVECTDGSIRHCYPRGKKSDVVVGDEVDVQPQGQEQGVILAIHPRRNLLRRADAQRSKSFAANIDQLLIVIAGEPLFSPDLLGRVLVAAYSEGIVPLILLNKADLSDSLLRAKTQLAQLLPTASGGQSEHPPESATAPRVLTLSALDAHDLRRQLMPHLTARRSLLLGQSGMGKSTLLNTLVPHALAATQTHSTVLATGRHTTTSTRLYHLQNGEHPGQLIDSPGFQSFGLNHLSPQAVLQSFPDLLPHAAHCRFYNCTHQHEPGCGILAALSTGRIPVAQHALYQRILQEIGQRVF